MNNMLKRETLGNVQGSLDFNLFGVIPKYVHFTRSYNVGKKEILVVAGDRGGWNAVEPPLLRALDAGCNVNVYLTATCGEQYANGKLQPDKRMIVESGSVELIEMAEFFNNSDHHLTVIASSQSKEGTKASWRALLLSHSAPKIGVQDMYGSSMPTLRMMDNALDCLCVADEFAREMVLQKFPGLKESVVVTGGPQFDKIIEVKKNWKKDRRRLRQLLQFADSEIVFLVISGLNGTVEMLELLETGIEQAGLSENAKVILRIHPRATDEDKRLVNGYMHATKRKWFVYFDHNLAPTSEDLLPAADFLLSGYSTTNYFGILYKMPGVVYVGTPAFKRDLRAEKDLDRPPEVEIGAGWYVQTGADMERVITTVRLGVRVAALLKMGAAQKKVASYNDGHATDRVWQEMQKLMTR